MIIFKYPTLSPSPISFKNPKIGQNPGPEPPKMDGQSVPTNGFSPWNPRKWSKMGPNPGPEPPEIVKIGPNPKLRIPKNDKNRPKSRPLTPENGQSLAV